MNLAYYSIVQMAIVRLFGGEAKVLVLACARESLGFDMAWRPEVR